MRYATSIGAVCFGVLSALNPAAIAPRAAEAPVPCSLKRVASLDASTNRGQLLINIKLNGRDSSVMVDTGSPFNLISADLATELKLPLHTAREGATVDASGNSFRHYVTVEKLELGGMSANDVLFLVMGENSPQKLGVDGIFGANFLAAYDVELDLAHGKLNLFLQNRCDAPPVYWTQDYASVRFQLDASLHPVLPVSLDGQELQAILDTGATPSTLSAQVAKHRFNIDPIGDGTRPDAEERAGTGHELPVFGHRFSELNVGGVAFRNTELMIIPDKISRIIRSGNRPGAAAFEENKTFAVAIGLHHLTRVRAYIAYGEQRLYISAADAK